MERRHFVLDRLPWSCDIILWRRHWRNGLIREQRHGTSATIFHGRWQQSDILVCEQLQQGVACTIDKEATP
jgi:hypothetical protein